MRILDIQGWAGWDELYNHRSKSNQPWYTHEWITHHVVVSPPEFSWEANIEDLIKSGLFDLTSAMKTSEAELMWSLYHRCVHVRSADHHSGVSPTPLTEDVLCMARRLALCFANAIALQDEPLLSTFIDFLALSARP